MAKDIKYQQDITNLLSPYANEMEDERLGIFLTLSVGRVLLKNNTINITPDSLRHITDWLKAVIINNDAWISNLDDKSRPKKLMKFNSIDQIAKEADKAMLIAAQRLSRIKISEGDEELFAELQDGYYLVKLLTPNALDRESSIMQHCIGNGGYDNYLNRPEILLLSLRDSSGNPHVTLDIRNNNIRQIQGKQNKVPIKKYRELLSQFLQENSYKINPEHGASLSLGYYINEDNVWYDINNIPNGSEINHDFPLSNHTLDEHENIHLPNDLTINGYASLLMGFVKNIPNNFVVKDLFIENMNHEFKDENIFVKGDLVFKNSSFKRFPSSIHVNGDIDISDNKNLESLPDNFHGRSIYLNNTPNLKTLPSNMVVKKRLSLINSGVTELPADLIVKKELYIEYTKIKKIPDHITSLEVLLANSSDLEDLANLKLVSGTLEIKHTKIKKLPDGLEIEKTLNASFGNITDLSNVKLGENILLSKSSISILPENLDVKGHLDLSDTSNIKKLPKGLRVGSMLSLGNSAIEELCKNLKVGGCLNLENTIYLRKLPKGLSAQSILLRGSGVKELPDDISIAYSINIAEGQLSYLPDCIKDHVRIAVFSSLRAENKYYSAGEYREILKEKNSLPMKL